MKLENKQELERLVHLVETGLDERLQVTPEVERQKRVIAAMQYSLDAGGKRIRPVLVLEFCRLCGGSVQQAMAAACAIEMIHTFSLIHDDLPAMDNDDFRRGKPSCHKAFDEATAILAGDALSVQAFRVIAEDPVQDDAVKVQLMQILAEATSAAGMIGGQVMDMEYETRDDVTQADLEAMCAAKTGALIRGACRLGCVAAGASESVVALADQYGAKLGLAFQIVDDILDVTSTTDVLGKPVGSDAEEGKTTFVTLLGLERAREEAARLTQEAEELLQQFVGHEFLLDLTDSLLNRGKITIRRGTFCRFGRRSGTDAEKTKHCCRNGKNGYEKSPVAGEISAGTAGFAGGFEEAGYGAVSGTVSGDSESADRNSFQDRRTFGFESGSSGADGGNAPCFHFSGR